MLAQAKARLIVIRVVAEVLYDLGQWEHLLVDFLAMIEGGLISRSEAVELLTAEMRDWAPGSVEVLEFTMRKLQWPEIKRLLDLEASDPDFRVNEVSKRVLEVWAPVWENGDIYATYRRD